MKSEIKSVSSSTSSNGKTRTTVTSTSTESSFKRSYHEKYPMAPLISLPVFLLLFILGVLATTIIYFNSNIDTYMPGGKTYVQYTEQQLIDMQLDYELDALGGNSLRTVFDNSISLLDAEQLVTNGDFNTPHPSGWASEASLSPSITLSGNGFWYLTGHGSNASTRGYRDISITYSTNNKFYGYIHARVTNNSSTQIVLENRTTFTNIVTQTNPVQNQWYGLSGMYTAPSNQTVFRFYFYHSYADASTANGKVMEVDTALLFNISTLQSNKQYSPIYDTTFDLMTDADIKTQMDAWVQEGIENVYLLSYEDFLTYAPHLTVSEMMNYYEVYLDVLDGNINDATKMSLGTIDPNTGKDFYFLDTSEYKALGNNVIQGYKSFMDIMSGIPIFISDFSEVLDDIALGLDHWITTAANSIRDGISAFFDNLF